MTRRSQKGPTKSDFGAMLEQWNQEHPGAAEQHQVRKEAAVRTQSNASDGSMADQLRHLLPTPGITKAKRATQRSPVPAPSVEKPRVSHDVPERSPEDIMQQAFEAMAVEELDHTEKFHPTRTGRADALIGTRDATPSDAYAGTRSVLHDSQRDLNFEDAMAMDDVQKWEDTVDRVRLAMQDKKRWSHEASAAMSVDVEPPTADVLISPSLNFEQKKIIKRVQKLPYVPEVNLRLLTKKDALRQLEDFVEEHRQQGQQYVRVVTGKGIHSAGDPVIKPAVMEWCEQQRALARLKAFTPAPDFTGNYGVLILELKR